MNYTGKDRVVAAQTLANAEYYARAGALEVRCSRDEGEIVEAQKLRYRIFYEEMSAAPTPEMAKSRRDMDLYDPLCDHLLVLDHSRPRGAQVVGTYRLLRQHVADRHGGFYSAQEYDLGPLTEQPFTRLLGARGQLLELGRSCVHPDYRSNATISLLWKGIAGYLAEHDIAYMFGCASLPGTDPEQLKIPLAYLWHEHLCPSDFMVRAVPERFVAMNAMPRDGYDVREARRLLPPLIKGYLRLGCFIGDGAVVDYQFGTTDVFILLPVERVTKRYAQHFSVPGAVNDGEDAATAVGG